MSHSSEIAGSTTERRIGWLTLVFGAVGVTAAALTGHRTWAGGLAVGTGLGWLNFRWLARALDALVVASIAQQAQDKAVVPWWTYVLALFRYALIGLIVYVIFKYRNIPLASMFSGLCALAVAAIVASVWEIFAPQDR